jgi:DNA-binding NarL/FixJ family response regulator
VDPGSGSDTLQAAEEGGLHVLIADDHTLFREALSVMLETIGAMRTTVAADLDQVREIMSRDASIDLILLDLNMPGMNGLGGLSEVMAMPDCPPVAMLSGAISADLAMKAIEYGAMGYIPKTLTAKTLVNVLRFIAAGERYLPFDYIRTLDTPDTMVSRADVSFSTRELQVLQGITEGKANKTIARDLGLAEATVKLHIKSLYRKIDVPNRTRAALFARQHGLF